MLCELYLNKDVWKIKDKKSDYNNSFFSLKVCWAIMNIYGSFFSLRNYRFCLWVSLLGLGLNSCPTNSVSFPAAYSGISKWPQEKQFPSQDHFLEPMFSPSACLVILHCIICPLVFSNILYYYLVNLLKDVFNDRLAWIIYCTINRSTTSL